MVITDFPDLYWTLILVRIRNSKKLPFLDKSGQLTMATKYKLLHKAMNISKMMLKSIYAFIWTIMITFSSPFQNTLYPVQRYLLTSSVPDPDPPDPRVFLPPGSGSFYHHAKLIRKILNPTIL
jgi:hypothetical protein